MQPKGSARHTFGPDPIEHHEIVQLEAELEGEHTNEESIALQRRPHGLES